MTSMNINLSAGAIVCAHIAKDHVPMCVAVRTDPVVAEDSGWQFLCDSKNETLKDAQLWQLSEVIAIEPTLKNHLHLPAGTLLTRKKSDGEWVLTNSL
jgi:hypothetical protein